MTMHAAMALLILLAAAVLAVRSILRARCMGGCAQCTRAKHCPAARADAASEIVPVPWDGSRP